MDQFIVIELLFLSLVIWTISKFYWLRVIFCILVLMLWGAFSIGAPIFLGVSKFVTGSYLEAFITITIGIFLGFFWLIGADAAKNWYNLKKVSNVGFWQKWDAK